MASKRLKSDIQRDRILEPVRHYWGFRELRPLQEEAIRAGLDQRDSVVVLPTGGGKSLCYQVPPLVAERVDVVVSPLIALMKDQVDGLRACGYPAVCLHSGMPQCERETAVRDILAGKYRLVFVSPERILTPWFLGLLGRLDVRAFSIDEAHCISQWGHDFRRDYRQLATLKERFPRASVHAYTATATERVRQDIAEQLRLDDPLMLVGNFDRPNLTYRVLPRVDGNAQVADIIRRHHKEAAIVYCLSRKDTERLAGALRKAHINAKPYHAGMDPDDRRRTQDAFANESLDVVTATVAFGMGIDRSNVRCIIHATMPKSVEHYQQETGRAGRDGLEAECVLLYSSADVIRWEQLIRSSAEDAADPQAVIAAGTGHLEQMRLYCTSLQCRHRALSEYFDQAYAKTDCEACDVCLKEMEGVEDATETAQKILSCVARVREGFGVVYVAEVLTGADTDAVRRRGHKGLSTYGLLGDVPRNQTINWVHQLVDQGLLDRSLDDHPVLKLNDASWEVMRGKRRVMLMKSKPAAVKQSKADTESWEGVDQGLYEYLRVLRRELAEQDGVPAYVIFGDVAIRDMARKRPVTPDAFLGVHGVGDVKLARFGARFTREIKTYCGAHGLPVG
ncbi:MAG: DNA helicase RecQ [Planctomycetes bacterium]|nr:DNA helicase RecQ [Planctomycetota bacterium]